MTKKIWEGFLHSNWTAETIVFPYENEHFRGRSKKHAFGACIVVLRALPQMDPDLELLYKLQTHAFGEWGDFCERLQMHVYKHQMNVDMLFRRRDFEFSIGAFGAYIRASTGRAGTARVI